MRFTPFYNAAFVWCRMIMLLWWLVTEPVYVSYQSSSACYCWCALALAQPYVFVSSVLCLYGATGADGPASVLSEICECSRFHLLPIVTLFLKSDRLGVWLWPSDVLAARASFLRTPVAALLCGGQQSRIWKEDSYSGAVWPNSEYTSRLGIIFTTHSANCRSS